MEEQNTDRERHLGALTVAITGTAAVAAFFISPLLTFAPAGYVASFGITLAFSAGFIWLAIAGVLRSGRATWYHTIMSAMGLAALAGLMLLATFASAANDARCAHIQREMLLPNPRRDDLPALFDALRCRPQGWDDIQFPARKVPDAAAKPSPKLIVKSKSATAPNRQ